MGCCFLRSLEPVNSQLPYHLKIFNSIITRAVPKFSAIVTHCHIWPHANLSSIIIIIRELSAAFLRVTTIPSKKCVYLACVGSKKSPCFRTMGTIQLLKELFRSSTLDFSQATEGANYNILCLRVNAF